MSDKPAAKSPPLSKWFIWGMILDFAGQTFLAWNAARCYYLDKHDELWGMGVVAAVTGTLFVRKVIRIYRREYPKVVPADGPGTIGESNAPDEITAPVEMRAPIETGEPVAPPAV